jgi:transposase-like protein
VIAGLRGADSIAELCRKDGINQNLYYRWSKELLDAGKKRLAADTAREATSDEVKGLRTEAQQLKELLAEVLLEYMRYAASEKLEIIRLVEQSWLPVRRTLAQLGISRATFYRWYQFRLKRGRTPAAGYCLSRLHGAFRGGEPGVVYLPICHKWRCHRHQQIMGPRLRKSGLLSRCGPGAGLA